MERDLFLDDAFAPLDTARRIDDLPETGPNNDWVDPGFEAARQVNTRNFMQDLGAIAEETPEIREVLDREIAAAAPAVPVPPKPPAPVAPVVQPVVEQPEVIDYEDGSSVVIEKTPRGWVATLDSNTGAGREVFKGQTKDELLRNVLAGKLNASKKINKLNRQLKLGELDTPAEPVKPAVRTSELTADEVFEIKTQLTQNPDLALATWFQKKTGMSVEKLMNLAKQGEEANEKLRVEAEARQFRSEYPEYYPTDENLETLCKYLEKEKLDWNSKNLGIAFEELTEDGLLEVAPKPVSRRVVQPPVAQPTPTEATPSVETAPTPVAATPAPPANDPRIVGTRRQLRGSGIRQSDVTSSQPVPDTPPTDEELDNLSNEEINQLFAGVRRLRAQSARR